MVSETKFLTVAEARYPAFGVNSAEAFKRPGRKPDDDDVKRLDGTVTVNDKSKHVASTRTHRVGLDERTLLFFRCRLR